jgi:hypothetical protein
MIRRPPFHPQRLEDRLLCPASDDPTFGQLRPRLAIPRDAGGEAALVEGHALFGGEQAEGAIEEVVAGKVEELMSSRGPEEKRGKSTSVRSNDFNTLTVWSGLVWTGPNSLA